MPSFHLDQLSSFGQVAVKLDLEFSELIRLSGQIQRLDIDSDAGLERAVKLLNEFAHHGKNITEGIQSFSKFLEEAREKSEKAAELVAERAQFIHQRKQGQNQLREKLNQLEQNVKATNANLSNFRKGKNELSPGDQGAIRAELERLQVDLKRFLTEANAIKDEANQSNFKGIDRDVTALLDALRSSSRQVDKVISGQ